MGAGRAASRVDSRGIAAAGLAPVSTPDRRELVEPANCGGCGAGLAGAPGTVRTWVQVFDLPSLFPGGHRVPDDAPAVRLRTHHHRGRAGRAPRRAGLLRPELTAAASLLAGQDVLSIERTADLMSTLLGVAVQPGSSPPA